MKMNKHIGSTLVLVVMTVLAFGSAETEPTSSSVLESAKLDARVMAEQAVKGVLTSPATADFHYPRYGQGSGRLSVIGEVDSQNGFGATLTTAYLAVFEPGPPYEPDDDPQLQLVYLKVGDQELLNMIDEAAAEQERPEPEPSPEDDQEVTPKQLPDPKPDRRRDEPASTTETQDPSPPPATSAEPPNRKPVTKPEYEVRTWSDATGKFSVKAAFVSLANDEVTIRREDNSKVLTVPLDRLSEEDRSYIDGLK